MRQKLIDKLYVPTNPTRIQFETAVIPITNSTTHLDNLPEELEINVKGFQLRNRTHIAPRRTSFPQESELPSHTQTNSQKDSKSTHIRSSNRPKSKKIFARNKMRCKLTDSKLLRVYFRNQFISLLGLLQRRDDYFSVLRGKRLEGLLPLRNSEVEDLLREFIQAKGRDKGRIKFNHFTNEQLRSLKYKPKYYPTVNMHRANKHDESSEEQVEEEDEGEEEQQPQIDLATWKRRNGCGVNQRVYIVKGKYIELRKMLNEKGWFENEEVHSKLFDLKWTTQTCDIDFGVLRSGQNVNHFNNNHHLTSKYGISRRLRTLIVPHSVDVDRFYPRCFDLGDQTDFQNFIQNFKFSFVESVAKRFLVDKQRYQGLQLKMRIVVDVLRRRLIPLAQLMNEINNGEYSTIDPDEWAIITETAQLDPELLKCKLGKFRAKETPLIEEASVTEGRLFMEMDYQIRRLLEKMKELDPQLQINGFRNVWIAKPNFLSRGRGIKCLNSLYEIVDYCLGKDCLFVIQKYIENPLLIKGKKFDIRQWVLIEDFNPPVIWFYQECYLRFCGDDYSLDNIQNKFMHLTNNSIQKYNKNAITNQSMWEMKTFAEYIGIPKWKELQDKIKNIIVWSIKSCEKHVTARKGCFQLVGYDFMIDSSLNPWLIEINMSPSMDSSTPVTKKLVKMVQRDTAQLISAKKKENTVGLYTCIYKGDSDLEKYTHYSF